MKDLIEIIEDIRLFTGNYRKENEVKGVDHFFLGMLDISASLAELGTIKNRLITKEEENNWFKGSYHLDFWDSEICNKLYVPLVKKVEKLDFFRT